jgi:hypothetical protein
MGQNCILNPVSRPSKRKHRLGVQQIASKSLLLRVVVLQLLYISYISYRSCCVYVMQVPPALSQHLPHRLGL